MKPFFTYIGLIFLVLLIIFFAWKYASRRLTLPCPSWLGWFVELDNPFTKSNRSQTIIGHLDIHPGMHVLDIGCGPGRLTIPLARSVGPDGKVTAIDIQSAMLQRTKDKARAENLKNIDFIQTNVGEGKLDLINQAERAVLVTVLGEIPNREAALKEIFNALKPGGILSVTEVIFDPHFQRRKTVVQLAHKVGFRVKNFFGNWAAYSLHLEKPPSIEETTLSDA